MCVVVCGCETLGRNLKGSHSHHCEVVATAMHHRRPPLGGCVCVIKLVGMYVLIDYFFVRCN